MIFGQRNRSFAAKCPDCGEPHHYVEIKFPMVNDRGGWVIECSKCKMHFTVALRNPQESVAKGFTVISRFDDDHDSDERTTPAASEIAEYSLDVNSEVSRFRYGENPIYRCINTGEELESAALMELKNQRSQLNGQIASAINYALSSRTPDVEHAVIQFHAPCTCGHRHRATFYFPFRLDGSAPPEAEDMLLADIEGSSLEDELTGIFSKSFLMDALEKLIVRWRLKFDQVVIASPFIAHQWMSKQNKLAVWEWFLGILEPQRTTFITRLASYKGYKDALLDSGLDHKVLADFGLENRIIGAGTKKQDFHAKVYIGLGERSEVLSGSANLLRGPSLENASFSTLPINRLEKRYLAPLGVTPMKPSPRPTHHLLIEQSEGTWRARYLDGASPI